MTAEQTRVLSVAVRCGRIAVVFFEDAAPKEWALSVKAARSARDTRGFLGKWLSITEPSVVVLEDPETASRKGRRSKATLATLERVARQFGATVQLTCRVQQYPNVYSEAKAFAAAYPQLAHKLPTSCKIWESEPRNVVYTEALGLAQSAGFLPLELPE